MSTVLEAPPRTFVNRDTERPVAPAKGVERDFTISADWLAQKLGGDPAKYLDDLKGSAQAGAQGPRADLGTSCSSTLGTFTRGDVDTTGDPTSDFGDD